VYTETANSELPAQSPAQHQSFTEDFALVFSRITGYLWLPVSFVFIFILVWIGWDSLQLTRLEPEQLVQLLYRRLRRLARPVTGTISKHQTAHSYSDALNEKMLSLVRRSRLQNLLLPAEDEINQLTELYARSLFSPASPTRMDARSASKAWSCLRWRLILANLLTILNAKLYRIG
jgi:hypothetical protein